MHYIVYRKQKKQQSSDNGVTWTDVVPAEYQKGSFIRENTTCSEDDSVQSIYKWDDDNLLVTQNDGLTWESTGVEREDSMSDAPDSVKEINGREVIAPIEFASRETVGIVVQKWAESDASGTYIALFWYDNPDMTGSTVNQAAIMKSNQQPGFVWSQYGTSRILLGTGATTDYSDLPEWLDNGVIPYYCARNQQGTFYVDVQYFNYGNSRETVHVKNPTVIHDYNPSATRGEAPQQEESNEPTRRVPVDYNSYYLYQKYARSSTLVGADWYPAYPFEYSASTEVAITNDPECGYESPTFLQYRWIDTDGIICDEVSDEPQYSWQETGAHLCYGGSSYAVECYMVSYNGGLTWSPVPPPEYRKGRLLQANSDECNQTVEVTYTVSKSSLGSTFRVISETSGIQSAVLDGDVEIPVNNGYMDTSWLADGSTGFTLTFNTGSYLQDQLFSGIGFIQSVALRQGVTYIGDKCFYGTTLSDLYVYGKSVYLGDSALPSSISAIYVPSDRVTYYKSAYHWSSYNSIISSMS